MAIRVGLIGAGVMGTDHARILSRAVSGAELVAVSDPDAKRRRKIVEICATARIFADPLDLIRDKGVDAVLVASPDETHGTLVLACLGVGKPVLCEKPLAPSIEACLKVIDKEKALGRRLVTVGYMRRFDPGYVEMKRRLGRGRAGRGFGHALRPPQRRCAVVHDGADAHHQLGGSRDRQRPLCPRPGNQAGHGSHAAEEPAFPTRRTRRSCFSKWTMAWSSMPRSSSTRNTATTSARSWSARRERLR